VHVGFGAETEEKRPLRRLKRRWEGKIKWILKRVGWDMDWTDLAQDRTGGGLL
jgi:hypothetical protein